MSHEHEESGKGLYFFSNGNAAFVEENYEEAVDWYTKAIEADGENSDFYNKRAQAYLKAENYGDARKDSEKAISLDAQNSKAYLRKGIAEFHLDLYTEAKKSFQVGQQIDSSEKKFSTWIRKCDAEINTADQDTESGMKVGVAVGSEGDKEIKETADKIVESEPAKKDDHSTPQPENNIVLSEEPTKKDDPSKATPEKPSQPVEIPMPTGPKTRYDWYQTETHVIITLLVKKVKQEELNVDIQENTLSLTVKLPSGNDYSLELDLLHQIIPDKSITKILTSKVEIKLKKVEGIRWSTLEGDGTTSLDAKPTSSSDGASSVSKYPSSSHYTRDWDKVVADIKESEKDEKLEGDAALNNLFQKIYSDGSDEVRKAMNKSFSESGGTVLSTNWKDIGKAKTDIKAPDGMEWKKY